MQFEHATKVMAPLLEKKEGEPPDWSEGGDYLPVPTRANNSRFPGIPVAAQEFECQLVLSTQA